ncbi:uncharacterized protein HMPREF1541_00836 [Cyphellophora europaea CBS 101466]|uniref:Transcription factor domain-containing protein n=1 Tax=Cyphellophora europaea (strain CBS 101466) TaxID=1220924 RepID=W2SDE6_CYPE1|nr:uncharacterized protein HMPREF1541_00836 [Cyphellophora europaea CBS 101466]ETN46650.1 hypothetical protein HMPREF1541_00836 [Cyphellophora europaea CBS 101466]
MHRIVEDYILHVYPAIPVFHVPTFRRQFELQRDRHDQQFFGLVMGIVAVAVGLLPRKFNDYRLQPSFARFATRQDVIECCYSRATQARDLRYFDEISHTKWATAYVFSLAFFHIGKFNMSRIVECEANLYARLLEIPRISAYSGLNCIETQLRKKAFWLMFYGYVHLQHADFRRERPGFIDCATLHEIDLESLMPVPHDDEHITESSYGSPDPNEPSLAASFNLRSQVFWCAVKELPIHGREAQKAVHCHCTRMNNPVEYENYLQARLKELKYVLDKAPWYLRQWMAQKSPDSSASKAIHTQYSQIEIIRVDIHVTHIWLQSVIMDHLEMYRAHRSEASPARPLTSPSVAMSADDAANAEWAQREDLCRQLLQVLYSASDLSLETLGVILVQKTRDVAVSLLNCPYGDSVDSVGPGARAKAYLADFSRKLEDLDKAEGGSSLSVQSWIDTDRARAGGGNYS